MREAVNLIIDQGHSSSGRVTSFSLLAFRVTQNIDVTEAIATGPAHHARRVSGVGAAGRL